jgi:hypothetical protein
MLNMFNMLAKNNKMSLNKLSNISLNIKRDLIKLSSFSMVNKKYKNVKSFRLLH